jgi:hypothetical protein
VQYFLFSQWKHLANSESNIRQLVKKSRKVDATYEKILEAFTLGKKVIRRTTKSQEYLKLAKSKQEKQDALEHAMVLHKQYLQRSNSVGVSKPLLEGYVTEFGQDNKSIDGKKQELEKRQRAKQFHI